MSHLDYGVLIAYLFGIVLVGVLFSRRNRTSADMFAAGGQSPWWTSGLSAFMTMFSANTFVVWGGIGYRLGFTAVAINLMYGIAALAVGYFVAGHWKRIGVQTPAQYIQLRFGTGALHFYTWAMMLFRLIGTAGALYALATILVALMPLAEGNFLRDPATGNLSLMWAILIFGGIVVLYTMIGGLWAVLMTDVLQFIILNLAIAFVVPLVLLQAGGVGEFVQAAPEGFFTATGGQYTWFFLAGWCAIHFFMIGADWAFAQRFICVPNARDARRSSYLFGFLYLVSPILWLLPPMVWRVIEPIPEGASAETIRQLSENAYIHSIAAVLPAGMVGLMIAAMFSATASMVSSQLNVFSGVLTYDVYRPLRKVADDAAELVMAGRLFTILLGTLILAVALMIPALGGAERVIVGVTELMVVALLAPAVWGLFSRTITAKAVWITGGVGLGTGILVRTGLGEGGFLTELYGFQNLAVWVQSNGTYVTTFTGVVLPIVILTVIQWLSRETAPGYQRLEKVADRYAAEQLEAPAIASRLPAVIVGWALVACACLMGILVVVNQEAQDRLVIGIFGGVVLVLAIVILKLSERLTKPVAQGDSGAKTDDFS